MANPEITRKTPALGDSTQMLPAFPEGIPGARPLPAPTQVPDGCSQVGFHSCIPILPKIAVRLANAADKRAAPSHLLLPVFSTPLLPLLNHHQGACPNQGHAQDFHTPKSFPQYQGGQKHGQYGAGFINGGNLVHIPKLKGPEINSQEALVATPDSTRNRQVLALKVVPMEP